MVVVPRVRCSAAAVGEKRRVAVAASSPDGLEGVALALPVLWRAR